MLDKPSVQPLSSNGDVNAAVVKLSAYGLGFLVTSAGGLVGSALGLILQMSEL